jgi:hypothetical protein
LSFAQLNAIWIIFIQVTTGIKIVCGSDIQRGYQSTATPSFWPSIKDKE